MCQHDNWSQSYEEVNPLGHCFVLLGQRVEHLSGALGMANISHLRYACVEADKVDHRRLVVLAQLDKTVVPVLLLVFVRIPPLVFTTVCRSPIVSKPHIIALQGKHKSWCDVRIMSYPAVSGAKDAMLKKSNWRSRQSCGCTNSVNGENISIIGLNFMAFELKAIFLNNFLKRQVVV